MGVGVLKYTSGRRFSRAVFKLLGYRMESKTSLLKVRKLLSKYLIILYMIYFNEIDIIFTDAIQK